MSKLGQSLINVISEANVKGLVSLSASPNLIALRKKLHLTQKEFSLTYRIHPETLKKWEQGKRFPDSISRAYLKCIAENPNFIKRIVNA